MSGSETGVMTSSSRVEPFNVGHQRSPTTPSQPVIQNLRLAFSTQGSAVYKPVNIATNTAINNNSPPFQPPSTAPAGAGGGGTAMEGSASGTLPPHGINVNAGSGGEAGKRKRGRPRKYGPDGSMAMAFVQPAQPVAQPQQQQQQSGGAGNGGSGDVGFLSPTSPPASAGTGVASAPAAVPGGATVDPSPSGGPTPTSAVVAKKGRGRPPGSTNKKHHGVAMGSVPDGFGFRAHILTVKAGEDVSSRIMAFSQHGPRSICVLSATGSISHVTIRQPSTSGGTVTYEGKFEILSLSGSFMPLENGSRTGGLQVALSGSDGRILGGGVAGVLIAATPIQLVVGSFIAESEKQQKSCNNNYMEPATAIGRLMPAGGTTGPSSPASRGTLSESSGGPGSPIHQNSGAYNNSGISSMSWK